MNKTWSVLKHELINTIGRRSFILLLILVPLIPALVLGVLGLLNDNQTQSFQEIFVQEAANPLPIGVVDESGVIREYPEWITNSELIPVENEAVARQKVAEGKLEGFYIIPQDYLSSGQLTLVKKEVNPLTGFVQTNTIDQLLDYNLMGADADLYRKYTNTAEFTYEELEPGISDTRDPNDMGNFFLPYAVILFFYITIFTSSSMILKVVTKEKENRVIEVLLSSLKPIQMFAGKILALGIAGLLQVAVWFGSAVLLMRFGVLKLNFPISLQLPVSSFFYAIPFFLLGYGIYATLMAGIGAMVPNLKEANQSTFVLILPLLFTMISINNIVQEPHGSLSTILSLFPLTSPVAMMARIVIGNVPVWQIILAFGLLILTLLLLVRSVSNLFRAQTLLTGTKFSVNAYLKALFQR